MVHRRTSLPRFLRPRLLSLPGSRAGARAGVAPLLGLALLLSGCADGPAGASSEDSGGDSAAPQRPLVLTTFTVLADIVAEVGGERVEVRSITPPGAEIHEYDPTPGDIRGAAEADLVITNGLELEAWFEQFIAHADAPAVTVTEDIDAQPVTRLAGHPAAAEQMPTNPHAWLSPQRGLTYVDAVEEALAELSPEDAEHFAENAAAYREQIRGIGEDAQDRVAAIEEETGEPVQVVTCEGAFSYLAEDLGLEEHYLWPINADSEGTPQQVEAQIAHVREHEVPTIFCETTVNDDAQQQVADAAGATLGDPLHVDSLSAEGGPVPSYLELLRHDLELILDGADPTDTSGSSDSSDSSDPAEED